MHREEPARRLFVVWGARGPGAPPPAGAAARRRGRAGARGRARVAALAWGVAVALAWGGTPARAQEGNGGGERAGAARTAPRSAGSPWLPRVRLDNDAYNFWLHPGHRTDEEYTNGVVLAVEALRAPWWGKRLGGAAPGCAASAQGEGACLSTQFSLAQEMYTPNLDRPPYSSPDWERERPYAAWLYVGAEGRRISARALRTYSLAVGVTGPPALGSLAQSIAHAITSKYTTRATGWETQVAFEPGVVLGVRQSLLLARWAPGGHGVLDLAPSAAVSLGNIRTAADLGARVRMGINLSHPWDPREWRGRGPWELQLQAGGRREYVAHDFSLDGTLFTTPTRLVTRVPTVSEYEFGAALRLRRLTVGWRAVTRSREYATGPARHAWSQMYSALEFH